MMIKILLLYGLYSLFGSPVLVVIVILVALYFIDRKFVGLMPSLSKPFRRSRRLNRLKIELSTHPHHTRDKLEMAWLLIEKRNYNQALVLLQEIQPILNDSADVLYALGLCRLRLGELALGEQCMLKGLELNPKVKYGEPYLRLGEAFSIVEPVRALEYLQKFREMQSSSCEAYYRLGQLYERLGQKEDARGSFREALVIYRSLPKYKRRIERKFAYFAVWKTITQH